MKKIFIGVCLLFVIFLSINSNSVLADSLFSSNIDDYNNISTISSSNADHYASLCRNYILNHTSDFESINNAIFTNNSIFNYCCITGPLIYFSDEPFVWRLHNSNANCDYCNAIGNVIVMTRSNSNRQILLYNNCNIPIVDGGIATLKRSDNYNYYYHFGASGSNYKYFVSSDIYDPVNFTTKVSANFEYTYLYEDRPYIDYDIHISEINSYVIVVKPHNISTPYDLHAYITYNSAINNEELIRDFWLEENSSNVGTGFHVDLDVNTVELVYTYGDNKSFSYTLDFSPDGTVANGTPIVQVNEHESSLNAYSSYEFSPWDDSQPNGEGYYKVTTDIYTFKMKNGYKVYYDYDGTRNFIDLNYQYGTNEYHLVVNDLQKQFFEENGLTMYFYIVDETGKVFYTKKHTVTKNGETSSHISNESGLNDSDYNYIYGQPNQTYNGYFGDLNLNNMDLNNLDVNTGVTAMTGFFNSSKDIFGMIIQFISFLPNWITVPLSTLLVLMVIITIVKLIRG